MTNNNYIFYFKHSELEIFVFIFYDYRWESILVANWKQLPQGINNSFCSVPSIPRGSMQTTKKGNNVFMAGDKWLKLLQFF